MHFSEFAKLLHPICGNESKPNKFVLALVDTVMEEPPNDTDVEKSTDDNYNPLISLTPDYLNRIYDGSKNIPIQKALVILPRMDRDKFSKVFDNPSMDALTSLCSALEAAGVAATPLNVGGVCFDLFEEAIKSCTKRKKRTVKNKPVRRITEHTNLPSQKPQNECFTGRVDQLESIHDLFMKKGAAATNICQTISGLGGVGKTQLAIEYAYRYCSHYNNCIWFINAETAAATQECFVEFAKHFKLKLSQKYTLEELQAAVKTWLSENNKWLLIFDNLESTEIIMHYLPEKKNGRIIITTRNTETDFGHKLSLGVFCKGEALLFLKKRLSINGEINLELYNNDANDFDSKAPKLISRLGYLPLALEQAAAYIVKIRSTITNYLLLLTQSGLKAFEDKHAAPRHYEKIVTTTWSISIKAIDIEGAKQLISLCAYMAPDRIPVAFFAEMCDKLPIPIHNDMTEEIKKNGIVTKLREYSLTGGNADNIDIHRLVQEVIRKGHREDASIKENYWLELCLDAMGDYIPRDVYEARSRFVQIAPHATAIAEEAKNRFRDKTLLSKTIKLFNTIGESYDNIGYYEQALEHHTNALAICEKTHGVRHTDTAQAYVEIGIVLHHLRKPDEALERYKQALPIREKELGKYHEKTANIYNNIAIVYGDKRSSQYNHIAALEWFQKSLAVYEKIFGKDNIKTGNTFRNIGCLYNDIGKYDEALKYHMDALKIRCEEMGEEHPFTAQSLNDIGDVNRNQSDWINALDNYSRALAIREKALGEAHPRTIHSYRNVASVYEMMSDSEKSKEYLEKAEEASQSFSAGL